MPKPIKLFYSYAREDELLRKTLETHLATLKKQGLIQGWHDRQVSAGAERQTEIDKHLEEADIILLLVSADFINSEDCFNVEMKRALERHEAGSACVIPVIVRDCYWKGTPFAKLQAVPKNAKPVMSWKNRDKAWSSVAHAIRDAIDNLEPKNSPGAPRTPAVDSNKLTPAVASAAPTMLDPSALEEHEAELTNARDELIQDGTLDGFERVTRRHWQTAHERVGWRLFTSRKRDCFAFMGFYHGEGTLQEGVPDLYFFLEANRHSDAQKAFDAMKGRIVSAVEQLNAKTTGITWSYEWGGWESLGARKSMATIPEASFQEEVTAFFRAAAQALRACGLLDEFLTLARAEAS
jgi:hypothetical protein